MSRAATNAGEHDSWLSRLKKNSEFVVFYAWKYRGLVIAGLFSLLVVDLLEIIPPILMKRSVDTVVDHHPVHELTTLALLYLAITLVQCFGRYGWRMFLIRASFLSGRDLRLRFTDHLFGLSASFFEKNRVGDLLSLATNDSEAVRMAIGVGLLTLADALLYFIMIPVAMWMLSPKLAVLGLAPLVFVPWFVIRNERKFHDQFEKVQESFGRLSAMAQENLNGIRVVKAFAVENIMLDRFAEAGREFIRRNLGLGKTQAIFAPTLDFVMSLGLVLLLFVGGHGVIAGAVTLGTFVAFQRYIQKMVWPMIAVGYAISMHQRATASTSRIKEVLTLKSDVPDPEKPELPNGAGKGHWRTAGRIEFRKLSFSFPGSPVEILRDISLTVEPGERVAFIGIVGSGKSALLSLLPRLYPVERGMLFVDGVDINDWPLAALRSQMGYVAQEVFLFSESVRDNITFGLHEMPLFAGESEGASAQAAEEAATLAAVHTDALGLVKGYATLLGERGVNLSGGQKQRMTIARAIAKRPSILILDDALSSVDVQTEEKILRGLRARPQRNTELIAAHRISTAKDADRIVVLAEGRMRQLGTHSELLRDSAGLYARFYEQQQLKEELESYVENTLQIGQ